MKCTKKTQTRIQVTIGLLVFSILSSISCGSFDSEPHIVSTTASTTSGLTFPVLTPTVIPPHTPESPNQIILSPTALLVLPTVSPEIENRFTLTRGDPGWRPRLHDQGNWINSEPLILDSMLSSGKIVLVDFWTYTCINCVRTLPYLQTWHEKYSGYGLVILGIHSPEFVFERKYENVLQAVVEFGLEYPVVQDNDHATWRAFSNHYWPAKYLIDSSGHIRYLHFGEGAYDETEHQIRALLIEAGHNLAGISATTNPTPMVDPESAKAAEGMDRTRELYAGYERNFDAKKWLVTQPYIKQVDYYDGKDEIVRYIDPGFHENHFMYIHGLWRNRAESLVHAHNTDEYEDYIAIKFFATSVNAVIASRTGQPYSVKITLDGSPIPIDKSTVDINYDNLGNSFINVDTSRLYYLIDHRTFTEGELKLSSKSSEFSLFSFTFGDYIGGEP